MNFLGGSVGRDENAVSRSFGITVCSLPSSTSLN